MSDLSLVSLIIPVYNCENYVLESVSSVLRQSYSDLEVIICDDSSTDGSFEVLRNVKDSRITLLRNERNLGYLRTINRLFSLAKGSFIAFQDADDISNPNRIHIQMKQILKNNLDLIGTNYVVVNEKGKAITDVINPPSDSDEIHRTLIKRNIFQKPSILFRRVILENVGGFRESFLDLKNISEDYDWLLRIDEAGFRMGNVCHVEPLYKYRSVPTAMTKGFVHVEQLFGEQVAQFLAKERREGGMDAIERCDFLKLDSFIESMKQPFVDDHSLFFVRRAEQLMYSGLISQAIMFAYRAVLESPFSLRNLRTLQHCIRKKYLGF